MVNDSNKVIFTNVGFQGTREVLFGQLVGSVKENLQDG